MRPRAWMSVILSVGLLGAAVGAAAQQQQQQAQKPRANVAAARAAAARPAAARQPAAQAAPARAAASPSLFDRFASMVGQLQARQQAAPPPADPNTPQALPVNWTAATRYAQAAPNQRGAGATAAFVARNRKAIDSLSVPVLLPGDPDLMAGLRIFPHGDFYTISSTSNGMSFLMTGHSRAYPLPPGTVRSLGRGGLQGRIPPDGIVIEGSDTGLDADFSRFGAAYSIALQCRNLMADPRCGNDAYVRGVIARLTVVTPTGRG